MCYIFCNLLLSLEHFVDFNGINTNVHVEGQRAGERGEKTQSDRQAQREFLFWGMCFSVGYLNRSQQ